MTGLADHLRASIEDNVCLCPPSDRHPQRVQVGALSLNRCDNCGGFITRPAMTSTRAMTPASETRGLLRDLLGELTTQPLWNEGQRGEQIQALTTVVQRWHP
jgi:hypothetical protein